MRLPWSANVDSILRGITRKIDQLNSFAVSEQANADDELKKARELDQSASARVTQVQRAQRISQKIQELVG